MNKTALEILKILEESRGEAVSGERIAKMVHITRSAVWKNINSLKKAGFLINSTNNKGYELTAENDIFHETSIYGALSDLKGEKINTLLDIEVLEEVTSTNTLLKEEARAGAKEGRVLVAKRQTLGRGRLGRSFFSPKKGIYLSFVLRPAISFRESLLLTTIGAVAVTEAVKEVTGKIAGIKWVNDVYLEDKKICGILTEAEADVENGSLSYAVVGIGLNLTEPDEGLSEELKDVAGFIYGKEDCPKGTMARLVAAILRNYFYYYEKLPEPAFMEAYRNSQILVGKDIFVFSADEKKLATVLGVDDEARLLVKYPDGREEALFTGEVSVREVGKEASNPPQFQSLKKSLLSLFVFFALFLTACKSKDINGSGNVLKDYEIAVEKGYVFHAVDEEFYIGEDISEKLKRLIEPNSSYEAPSCARLGEDVVYTYSGFSLTASKGENGEEEVLYSILLTDDSVMTAEGIYIGESEDRVKEVYGNMVKKGGNLTYQKGEMELNFVIKDGAVISIEYRSSSH